ncbi:MAG: 50S ribosomal protein L7 [Oscillospiraceae bacterium]|jgi:ribosomal protein L7Ae-like RNA K-turn-binding protein|nr:50S ribosomal protein L7 [Oscillospiraceae bacterium]
MRELLVLGLAKKAGLIEIGEESVSAAAHRKRARLILSASDASDASKRHARAYADTCGIAWALLPLDKASLADVLGRGAPGMLAICDWGLAAKLAALLAEGEPEKYNELSEQLNIKVERANRRRRETAAHRRNVRTGKRRNND